MTSDQSNAIPNEVYLRAAKLMREGKSDAEIRDTLTGAGVAVGVADAILGKLNAMKQESQEGVSRDTKQALAGREKARKDMLIGGLLLLGGLVVTVVTYTSVARSGDRYFILFGPVIYGGIRFFQGLTNYNKYKGIG